MVMKALSKTVLMVLLANSLLFSNMGMGIRTASAAEPLAWNPIQDNFNDGMLPEGWTISAPEDDTGSAAAVVDGKLKITNSGNGNQVILKRAVNTGTLTGKVLFEYKLTVGLNSRYNLCMPALYSDPDNYVAASQLLMIDDSMRISEGTDGTTIPMTTTAGHTYAIRYVLDYDSKTFDFLINDLTVAGGQSYEKKNAVFRNTSANSLKEVDFWIGSTEGNPGSYEIDDLLVELYTGDPDPVLVPIHDHFDNGQLPQGWTVEAPDNESGTAAKVEDGKLKVTNAGSGKQVILKRAVNSAKLAGKVLVEYDLDVVKNSGYNLCMPALYSDASNYVSASQLLMIGDEMTVSSGSGDQTVTLKIIEGHRYSIRYILDYDKKTFDVLVTDLNDNMVYSYYGASFKSSAADSLESVDFWIGSDADHPIGVGEYDIDNLTVEPYEANVEVPIDDYADVKGKISQAAVFKEGSPIVYVNGQRKIIENTAEIPKMDGGELAVPSSFLSSTNSDEAMVPISELTASGKTVFQDGHGLVVVSDETVFDPAEDAALIERTSSLFGLYVSPNGSDSAKGTFEEPFRTVDRARQEIADTKKDKGLPIDGVTVYLREGEYPQTKSIRYTADDSGSADSPIVYTSYPGEKAHITGSVDLSSNAISPVTDQSILDRLPANSRGKVVQIDLKALGITDYGQITPSNPFTSNTYSYPELFVDSKRQTLSRWPNEGFAYTGEIVTKDQNSTTFRFPEEKLSQWTKANDIWFQGLWTWGWYDDSLRALSMNAADQTVTVNNPQWGVSKGKPFYAFNLLEEIDSMGEWYLDRVTGILYYYPPYSMDNAKLSLSTLTAPLISLQDTANISFERLIIEESRGTGVNMIHTTNVRVAGSTLRNLGQQAVDISGGQHSGVLSSDIYEIDKGGVQLNGGDMNTLTPGNNYVENSNLYRTSLLNRTNVQPVLLTGVGNRVANNMFHDVPHQAIGYDGNDHMMVNNEVYNVLKETGDAGAFYTADSWNYYNDTIQNNVFHDIKGPDSDDTYSVYLDNDTSGQNVIGNLFYNVAKPILINGGRDNKVKNNVILNSKSSILGFDYSDDNADITTKTIYQRLIQVPYQTGIWASKYPLLVNILNDQPTYPKYNVVTDNHVYNSGAISFHEHFYQYGTIENNTSHDEAPVFSDLSELSGMDGLNTADMGLQQDEFRKDFEPVGNFRITYPHNGASDIQANRVPFSWLRADGADQYRLIIATDPGMQHIVLDKTVQETQYMARNLSYGQQTYYWKVEAMTGSAIYKDTKTNLDGVTSFTTSIKEIADPSKLLKGLQGAAALLGSAVEGTGPGQYAVGSKAVLQNVITTGQTLSANADATQDEIDSALTQLNEAVAVFKRKKNAEILYLNDIIPDLGNWVTPDRSTLHLSEDGKRLMFQSKSDNIVAGYKNVIYNNQILKFAAKFNLASDWQGFGFRAGTPDAVAWSGTSYLIIFKSDVIELHRFGAHSADLITPIANTFIESGKSYNIELSALDKADGVQIVLKVNDKEVINVTDHENYIADDGDFVLYDAGGKGIEISSVLEDIPPTTPPTDTPSTGPTMQIPTAPPSATLQVQVSLDGDGNGVANVNAKELNASIQASKDGTVTIEAKASGGTKGLIVNVPGESIVAALDNHIKQLVIDTGLAVFDFPTQLLKSDGTGPGNIRLKVSLVDPSGLSDMIASTVGKHQVYDFDLEIDGKKLSQFGDQPVKIQLDYKLQQGENPNQIVIYYINDKGKLEIVKNGRYDSATGKVSFVTSHFSRYAIAYRGVTFTDIAKLAWAKDAIEGLAARDIVSGVGGGSYLPNKQLTRAEFITMLMNAFNLVDTAAKTSFLDVKEGAWYTSAVASAQRLGIVNGRSDGRFGVEDRITRQDMAVLIYRTVQALKVELKVTASGSETASDSSKTDPFTDQSEVAAYASDAVKAIQNAGLINGIGNGKFLPEGIATRAEAAVTIWKLLLTVN